MDIQNPQKNYYVPMSDKAFKEIKGMSAGIWKKVYPYSVYELESVLNKINDMQNIKDNGMYIIAMFDEENIRKLLNNLSQETLLELWDSRLPKEYFIGLEGK